MSALHLLVVSFLIVFGATEGMQISRREFAKWKALRGFGRNSVRNAPPEMCAKALDIGIVMDRRSKSNGEFTDWMDIMEFVGNLTHGKFEISHDMTHIGVIAFDESAAEVLLDFDQGSSLHTVEQQMATWRPGAEAEEGPVEIDQALRLARDDLFTSARGYQEDQVLVLLTDGRHDTNTTAELVRELERETVSKVIVVGIGVPDPIQLWQISTDPNNVQNMMLPSQIEPVAENIKELACPNSNTNH